MRSSGQLDLLEQIDTLSTSKPKRAEQPVADCLREKPETEHSRAKRGSERNKQPSPKHHVSSSDPAENVGTSPRYLNVQAVAKRLAISIPTVWRWAREREDFPAPVHLGPGVSRWSLDDIEAFELRCRERSQP